MPPPGGSSYPFLGLGVVGRINADKSLLFRPLAFARPSWVPVVQAWIAAQGFALTSRLVANRLVRAWHLCQQRCALEDEDCGGGAFGGGYGRGLQHTAAAHSPALLRRNNATGGLGFLRTVVLRAGAIYRQTLVETTNTGISVPLGGADEEAVVLREFWQQWITRERTAGSLPLSPSASYSAGGVKCTRANRCEADCQRILRDIFGGQVADLVLPEWGTKRVAATAATAGTTRGAVNSFSASAGIPPYDGVQGLQGEFGAGKAGGAGKYCEFKAKGLIRF